MSHAAIDIAKAFAGPSATAHGLASGATKTGSDFDGHLQRAGRDGRRTRNGADDSEASRQTAADSATRPANSTSKESSDSSRRERSKAKPSAGDNSDDPRGTDQSNASKSSESPNQSAPGSRDVGNDSPQVRADAVATAAQFEASNTVAASPDAAEAKTSNLMSIGNNVSGAGPTPPPPIPTAGKLTAAVPQPDGSLASPQAPSLGAGSIQVGATSDAAPGVTNVATAEIASASTAQAASGNQTSSVSTNDELADSSSPLPAPKTSSSIEPTSIGGASSSATSIAATETATDKRMAGEGDPQHRSRDQRNDESALPLAGVADAQLASLTPLDRAKGSQSSSDDASPGQKTIEPAAVSGPGAKPATQSSTQPPAQAIAVSSAQSSDSSASSTSDRSTTGSGVGEVDRVRFLQRVSTAFRAADEQGGQIRLRLSPPELGSMKLELSVRNGLMTAHVQAESDTARNLLLDHLPQLRERLADHNIKIDHFDVELMNQQSGTPQNYSQNPNDGYAQPQSGPRRPVSTAVTAVASAPATSLRLANTQLDVTI